MRSTEYGIATVERGPTGTEPERGHHQPRVAEHLLRLHEPLALDAADEPIGVDRDVVEEEGGGVAEPDAVLVLGLAVGESLEARVEHEPRRTSGRVGEDRVEVGDTAVGDPLLAPRDAIADDHAVVGDGHRHRLQRPEVAPGLGLGGAVRHQQPLVGDASHPLLLLLAACRRR